MTTLTRFTIDPADIIHHELDSGLHMARYRDPFSPQRLGMPKYIYATGKSKQIACQSLMFKLTEMGGQL